MAGLPLLCGMLLIGYRAWHGDTVALAALALLALVWLQVETFLRPGRDPCQGLGFRVTRGDTGVLVGHPGFPGAHFAIAPDRRRVVVLLTNRLHTSGEPRPVDAAWSQLLHELEGA